MFDWDPAQYAKFDDLRLRPALDLLTQVHHVNPRLVYDLGAGRGEMARLMAERWPEATVIGSDTSAEMLERAATTPSRVIWRQEDVTEWDPDSAPDIVFSNAMLHWVPDHDALLSRIVASLAPAGILAIQMPLSWGEPSHRAMRDILEQGGPDGRPLGSTELRFRLGRRPVAPPEHYFELLAPPTSHLTIWTTRYYQALTGDDPVLEWMRGTALRPVLAALREDELAMFLPQYRLALQSAYPASPAGTTLYPFPRLFIVATR